MDLLQKTLQDSKINEEISKLRATLCSDGREDSYEEREKKDEKFFPELEGIKQDAQKNKRIRYKTK